MRFRKNIIVFDTETTGDMKNPFIYDIGWIALDENLEAIIKREYIVKEIYTNKYLMDSAYFASKRKEYNERLAKGEIKLTPITEIYQQLQKDIRQFKISSLAAYNIAFDYRAMLTTLNLCASHLAPKWLKLKERIKAICIWDLACDTILQQQDFKDMAQQNSWLTDKGNILTNAEVAYRYLTNNLDFVEDHTALSDVRIEVEILKHILENEKGLISYGVKGGSWHKVNRK